MKSRLHGTFGSFFSRYGFYVCFYFFRSSRSALKVGLENVYSFSEVFSKGNPLQYRLFGQRREFFNIIFHSLGIALPGHKSAFYFFSRHTVSISRTDAGGPRLGRVSMLTIVSVLQYGHILGLQASGLRCSERTI